MTANLKLLTVEIAGTFVVFALALFLAAGTLAWPAGWAFLVLFFGFTIALSLVAAPAQPRIADRAHDRIQQTRSEVLG